MTTIENLIERQLLTWQQDSDLRREGLQTCLDSPPIVTISRQTGSRGSYFASRLALALNQQRIPREVVDTICASTSHRQRILDALDQPFRRQLEESVKTIMAERQIDDTEYARFLCGVVLSFQRLGGVILVGRGANFILGPQQGLHVRFIAPKQRRIRNLVTYKNMTMLEAGEMIEESDEKRRDYIRQMYGADIDDPRHYDMVINAEYIDVEELVEALSVAYQGKIDKIANLHND